MSYLVQRLSGYLAVRDEKGQAMVEYALIIVFVAFVVFIAVSVFGPKVANIYNTAGNSLAT